MEQELLEELRAWFDDYVTGFYGEDEYVNANLKMKQSHSRRTCTVMLELADQIGLASENMLVLGLMCPFGRPEKNLTLSSGVGPLEHILVIPRHPAIRV